MVRLIAGLVCLAGMACADPDPDRIGKAWTAWLSEQGNTDGVLVVMRNGQEFARFESGLAADAPVDLQSTSKAITARCVASLVEEGKLDWDSPLSEVLPTQSQQTISALLTHSGGVFPDETQTAMPVWKQSQAPRWHEAAKAALDRTTNASGRFQYNNENYALLGVVIEAITGEGYADACSSRVLAPLGITSARLSAQTGAFGPWGGWQMSPLDYARFHRASFVGKAPEDSPLADMGGGVSYGLGMVSRGTGEDANYWHFGLLCFGNGDPDNGGSFTVNWGAEWSAFAAWRACVGWDALAGLDRTLIDAILLAQ